MKGFLKKAKYMIITGVVLGAVMMHFALAALFFSDSGANGGDDVRTKVRRSPRVTKARGIKKAPRKEKRPVAKRRIASGKITGVVRGRGAAVPPMASNPVSHKILVGAKRYLGVKYVWGGTDPKKGFDCSGLTQYVFREAGIVIPRVARRQFDALRSVKEPMPGDLVFFAMDGNDINHVGIYMGNGRFIHAPKKGDVVKYSNLNKMFWRTRYLGAGAAF